MGEITPEIRERLERAAQLYEAAAGELDAAAAHARRSGEHFRDANVPRGAAHAWAVRGHLLAAEKSLDEQAIEHSVRARV